MLNNILGCIDIYKTVIYSMHFFIIFYHVSPGGGRANLNMTKTLVGLAKLN